MRVIITFQGEEKVTSFEAEQFAYDGCHKIYIIESEADEAEAKKCDYEIYPIKKLKSAWSNSCSLKFISNWSLTKQFVPQFESVTKIELVGDSKW